MRHIYTKTGGRDPKAGDVALCGHVMVRAGTGDEVCPTCLAAHSAGIGKTFAPTLRYAGPDDEVEEAEEGGSVPKSSLDTAVTSTLITQDDLYEVFNFVDDFLAEYDNEEEEYDDWDRKWASKPELLARFQKMADALKPGNAWWPLVKESFEDGLEHQADDDLDLEEWAAGVLSDTSKWVHVQGGEHGEFRWDVWNSLDVHEGSGFLLVSASDGSIAFDELYLL